MRKINLRSIVLLAGLLSAASAFVPAARAATCYLDNPPAATLLLPYFEVDLDRPIGRTTLFSVNNASATAILTNVTLWSDLGVPTLWFHLYLTGYDVQTLNLRDLFNGILPVTASAGQDPSDSISKKGVFSQDVNFASCTGILPIPPQLPPSFRDHLRAAHTGHASALLQNLCAGQNLGDNVARGYVTVDTVNRCEIKNPSEPGYFGAGGMATNQNVLWGDFFLVDQENAFAQGEDLVRIEADPTAFHAGSHTFYGRYLGDSGADAREPLPTTWASRYVTGGAFSAGTELIAWRDSGPSVAPFPCGERAAPFPLSLRCWAIFDESEQATALQPTIADPPPPPSPVLWFPAAANRTKVDGPSLPVPYDFGWLYLDLNQPASASGSGAFRQSWVGTLMSANGRFSVGYGATPLDTGCAPIGDFGPGDHPQ